MCSPARCASCGKTTWAGCGRHVTQVMRKVPEAEQCTCRGPAVVPAAAGRTVTGRLRALFKR